MAALGQITIASLETLTNASPKSKLSEHTDIEVKGKLNLFGVTRMLETVVANAFRAHILWLYVSSHLDTLANSRFPQFRSLAIDAITCLVINIFDAHKDGSVAAAAAESHVPHWDGNEWQAVVLTPMMNSVLTGHAECIKAVIANLGHIIENCGPYIAKEGWELVLGVVEKIVTTAQGSGNTAEATERIEQAFKCVELIIHNSLHRVHISNLATLVAVIHYFATLRQNLNVSLLAVGFIHNVADYVCQQQMAGKLSGISEERVNEIWMNLLSRLREVGNDERGELRQVSYRTLEQILTAHAEIIPLKVWSYMLVDICSQLLQVGKIHYLACTKGGAQAMEMSGAVPTPTFSAEGEPAKNKPKVMRFDEETIRKEAEEEKIKEKSWEESITVLHSTVVRVLKRLYSIELAEFR